MVVKQFEDILAWQKSKALSIRVYKHFKYNKDFSFKDQIQRAAVSIMNNIAEGYERKGNKEFGKFLYISKGSCAEVRSMLYLAEELGYLSKEEFASFYDESITISKLLSGFIKSITL